MNDYERLFTSCPTCGSDVHVQTADEGTSSYVPRYGKGTNLPVPVTYADVAALLRDMADHVEQGDSFEGSVEYVMPDVPEWAQLGEPRPAGWEDPEVLLRCVYRIGNAMGQGSVRIIGTINPPVE